MFDENMFITKDLGFAAYLKSKGVDLVTIEQGEENYNPGVGKTFMSFVFRIKSDDPFVLNLQDEWENSRHCGEIKRVLYFHKILKNELFQYKKSISEEPSF